MNDTLPTSRRSPLGRFAPLLAAGLFLLAAAAAVPSAQEPGEDSEKLEAFRQAHDQWVETRRIISSTRADWVEAEAYLASLQQGTAPGRAAGHARRATWGAGSPVSAKGATSRPLPRRVLGVPASDRAAAAAADDDGADSARISGVSVSSDGADKDTSE